MGNELSPDPNWPGVHNYVTGTEFDVARMRKVAEDLERCAGEMKSGAGSATGLWQDSALTEYQVGTWPAASAFARSVGRNHSPDGVAGMYVGPVSNTLAYVYGMFAVRLEDAAKAIRANADEYDRVRRANGG
jgi:hypothetical protein